MNTRTNIKLIPDSQTIKNICDVLDKNNIPYQEFRNDPHCTIIYSPDIINIDKIVLPKIKLPIIGSKAHFEFFDTNDDGIVLVIEFESDSAVNLFRYLKQKYKFTTKYEEYRPHITIQKNMFKKTDLPDIDFNLYFDKLIKEII